MPRRKFSGVEDFQSHLINAKELIFDGTEVLTERPQSPERQKNKYSGKKGTHTDTALVLSDKQTWIYYVSEYYDGRNVDLGILKNEFPPQIKWFEKSKVLFDLGFTGVDKLYEFKELLIGEKKAPKSKSNPSPELSNEQKTKNQSISKERIFVEHAIGKIKRYRILKNRCRLKCQYLKNRIIGIAAALWNYRLMLTN